VDGVIASLQCVKKRVSGGTGARLRRKEFRARTFVSKGAALLNGSAQTAASLNGSNHVQQDERSEESSRARVPCDEHHARKEAEEQARFRVKEQARKEADEQHLRRKWPFMLNGDCGGYITSVQWVNVGSKVNHYPRITVPCSDSTQNSSVNGYSAAPGHISRRSEEGRTDRWPLRAAGLVNGLWRCDERLLWH
jgi:hypothetical protein